MTPGLIDLNNVEVSRAVLTYMVNGLPIFPCLGGDKRPATRHGFKDAIRYYLADEAKRKQFIEHAPQLFAENAYNVGIATGDVVDVLDVDVKDGKPGLNALRTLHDAGLLDGAVAHAQTPSGGWHLYFPAAGQRSRSLPDLGLDLKAEGGYVLASPSVVMMFNRGTIGFSRYTWVASRGIDEGSVLVWDDVTAALGVRQMERQRVWLPQEWGVPLPAIIDGLAEWVGRQVDYRNRAVYWAAHRAIEAGAQTEEELRPIVDASLRVSKPGDVQREREEELCRTIRSALKRGPS